VLPAVADDGRFLSVLARKGLGMLSTPVLGQEDIASFHRDGWVLVRGVFDGGEAALLDRWAHELVALPEAPGRQWVYREESRERPGVSLVNRIERISPFHQGFAELAQVLAAPVGQLLGEEAVLFKEKINFKMPGGGGFQPHQDSQAGWERYASYFVNAMVSIDEATLENGCLKIASGHHRGGISREWEPLTEEEMTGMRFEPCATQPGDLVLFDSYAPHTSEPNHSVRMRRMYFATYNRLSEGDHLERYYADKRASYPPDIEREPDKHYLYRV
jgi:hypothetical protein